MVRHDSHEAEHVQQELHAHLPSEPALRVQAIESLLVAKGMLLPHAVDGWIQLFSEEIGPRRGAHVVARSWVDPAFRLRLLANATAAITEFGYQGRATGYLQAVENSHRMHHLVVCTLCSCYPISLLGIAPDWYKSAPYRSRAVRDPRGVLAEFGVHLPPSVEVRVWDSTAEMRYLVIPQRPLGTDGWSEETLAALVTRNSMIGTQRVLNLSQG